MKLTKTYLRKIIKEEIEKTHAERRGDHIKGLGRKIVALARARDDINDQIAKEEERAGGDDTQLRTIRSTNSWSDKIQRRTDIMNKLDLLRSQYQQLQQGKPGKGGVGQLERG